MEKGYFHVVTRFQALRGEIGIWVNGKCWGEEFEVKVRSWLWEAGVIGSPLGSEPLCEATGLNTADLHPIDFSEQTIFTSLIFLVYWPVFCCWLEVTLFPLDSFFGLLLFPLVTVCCSNHDWQLLTKYDTSTSDSFVVWRKVEGAIKKLNLQRSLDLAQPSWEGCHHRKHGETGITGRWLSTCVKCLGGPPGAGGIVTRVAHSSCFLTPTITTEPSLLKTAVKWPWTKLLCYPGLSFVFYKVNRWFEAWFQRLLLLLVQLLASLSVLFRFSRSTSLYV